MRALAHSPLQTHRHQPKISAIDLQRKLIAGTSNTSPIIALSDDSKPHFTTLDAFVSDLGDFAAHIFAQVLYLRGLGIASLEQDIRPLRSLPSILFDPPVCEIERQRTSVSCDTFQVPRHGHPSVK